MKARITKAVADYTGEEPATIQIEADPKVSGVYAVRATFEGGDYPVDFLWNRHEADQAEGIAGMSPDAEVLEEVEFESWPPASGSPKFF